ncbi:MAG TPA: hypothetical protein VKM93_09070 [Terriglobia bacterium]|nr:hypothetical protein [Terriglobia bacterium]
MGRNLPATHSAFGHRVTRVEVKPDPSRVKRRDHARHVPYGRANVFLMVVVPGLDTTLLAQLDEAAKLCPGLFQFTPHVH